ncbi:hypothetical protein CYMTET_17335 [Cymbomonas tetramitiformis]|uniref:Uncharacterized protein n=1 Tax=Cymbomonas tetramitiformis TaxID=36881 RepID=A0AAE0GAJ7_9CHLO|nr:hypothetical protein CYMTET_17335 [Cymbomonas tetramitiformis]
MNSVWDMLLAGLIFSLTTSCNFRLATGLQLAGDSGVSKPEASQSKALIVKLAEADGGKVVFPWDLIPLANARSMRPKQLVGLLQPSGFVLGERRKMQWNIKSNTTNTTGSEEIRTFFPSATSEELDVIIKTFLPFSQVQDVFGSLGKDGQFPGRPEGGELRALWNIWYPVPTLFSKSGLEELKTALKEADLPVKFETSFRRVRHVRNFARQGLLERMRRRYANLTGAKEERPTAAKEESDSGSAESES